MKKRHGNPASLLIVLAALVLLSACVGPGAAGQGSTFDGKATISLINEKLPEYLGRKVTITGSFKGWKGPCDGVPPVSRSDWMIDDGTGCAYVAGPLPWPGLDSAAPADEPVVITGVVGKGPKGRAFIDARR